MSTLGQLAGITANRLGAVRVAERSHIAGVYVNDAADGYVKAALWTSTDDNDRPLDDHYAESKIVREARDRMKRDVIAFLTAVEAAGIDLSDERADRVGHDFWLTRNGHGAGFWDGDYPEHGDKLTAICKRFGEVSLYVNRGYIYHYPK